MTGVLDRVEDVAALIAQRCGGRVNVARLHVLLFYCQAWHVVFWGSRLFSAQIQAWTSGPVVTRLMRVQGDVSVVGEEFFGGCSSRVSDKACDTVDAVLVAYGHLSPMELGEVSRSEVPWLLARARSGSVVGFASSAVIRIDDVREFYHRKFLDGVVSFGAWR